MALGPVVGQLFVLFKLKTNKQAFTDATQALTRLRNAAAVTGVMHLAEGFAHMAEKAAEGATHIRSMSQAMGMSMAMTQRYNYLAEQSGSNLKELGVGVSMLQGNLRKLANGQAAPRLQQMFAEMGVTRADAIQARDHIDGVTIALTHMSARLKTMGVSGNAAADMRALVGARAGKALTADLMRGPEAIQAMFKNVEAKGGIISDKSLLNLQSMYQAINDIKMAWKGVSGEIIGALAPALTEILNKISKWFAENRELIGEVLLAAFSALSAAVSATIVVVDAVADAFKRAFAGDISMQATLIAIAGLLLSLVIPAFVSLAIAAWAAMAPFLLITAIVAALLVVVLAVRKYWSEIGDVINAVITAVGEAFLAAGAFVLSIFIGLGKAIVGLFILWYGTILKIWSFIIHSVIKGLLAIGPEIGGVFVRLGKWFVHLGELIWHGLIDIWDSFKEKAAEKLDWLIEKAKTIKNVLLGALAAVGIGTGGSFLLGSDLKEVASKALTTSVPVASATAHASAPPGSAAAGAYKAPNLTNLTVGPTTITINGVKGAAEAKDAIHSSIENAHRNALHGFGGETDQ